LKKRKIKELKSELVCVQLNLNARKSKMKRTIFYLKSHYKLKKKKQITKLYINKFKYYNFNHYNGKKNKENLQRKIHSNEIFIYERSNRRWIENGNGTLIINFKISDKISEVYSPYLKEECNTNGKFLFSIIKTD
jgi:hypothetical protein